MKVSSIALEAARKQFCLDCGLSWEEYQKNPRDKIYIQKTVYKENTCFPVEEGARCYIGVDSFFMAIMCMGQLFLSVDEKIYDWACEAFGDCKPEWFCQFDNLRKIDEKLMEYGYRIKDTHVYFLPVEEEKPAGDGQLAYNCPQGGSFSFVCYEQQEIMHFREGNRFGSAICFSPTQPDVLAVAAKIEGAESSNVDGSSIAEDGQKDDEENNNSSQKEYDQQKLAGMAGASLDGKYLWQIGINVVPEYTGKGLACMLVKSIKDEIIKRGKIPFYGTSESHTISQTIAWKAGFAPAWTEISVERIKKEV